MGFYFDTIRSVYNYDEREKLDKEYREKEKEWKAHFENYIDDDDDFDTKEEVLFQEMKKAANKCFAAQFPKIRNKWFAEVIENYIKAGKGNDTYFYISEKQFDCFSKYCREDKDSWATNCCYCRYGSYFITLKRLCGRRCAMKIKDLEGNASR